MNSRVIIFAPATGLNDLSEMKQFLFPDFRNYIFFLIKTQLENNNYQVRLFDKDTQITNQDILFFWNAREQSMKYIKSDNPNKYIVLSEPGLTLPANYEDLSLFNSFKNCFTYHDPIVDDKKFIKIFYPNHFPDKLDFKSFEEREGIVMISGHKLAKSNSFTKHELYSKRIEVIKWYEKNDLKNFALYGRGWDKAFFTNRILRKLNRYPSITKLIMRHKFISYKGSIDNKYELLSRSKFSFCFENVKNFEGCITEKIFDSMFAGCVPIYLGVSNIKKLIPEGCYVHYSDYDSIDTLNVFLKNVTQYEYEAYQRNIKRFLESERAHKFKDYYVANTIVDNIIKNSCSE